MMFSGLLQTPGAAPSLAQTYSPIPRPKPYSLTTANLLARPDRKGQISISTCRPSLPLALNTESRSPAALVRNGRRRRNVD